MADYRKLLAELFEEKESPRKNFLQQCYCTVKDYFGPLPLIGAVAGAGTVYVISFAVGVAYDASHQLSLSLNGVNLPEAVNTFPQSLYANYQHAKEFAGEWTAAGAAGGQFVTYRFKNFVKSLFAKKKE